MNRWNVYSHLKRINGETTVEEVKIFFSGTPKNEIREGIIEYNLACEHNGFKKMNVGA